MGLATTPPPRQKCLLMALFGHPTCTEKCPLLGVKRKWRRAAPPGSALTGRCRGLIADLLVVSVRPAIDGIRRQVGVTLLVESELTDHGVELVLVEGLDHVPHVGSAGRLRRQIGRASCR